jgi:hypothetical protein
MRIICIYRGSRKPNRVQRPTVGRWLMALCESACFGWLAKDAEFIRETEAARLIINVASDDEDPGSGQSHRRQFQVDHL